jgi:hypothetical protein
MTPCSGAVQIARTCDLIRTEFLIISVDGGGIAFDGIVTGMSLSLAANYQFMHSLDDFIYVYAFGDRIGDLSFNGVGFVNACGGDTVRMGILRLYEFYKTNSASEGGVKILNITLTSGSTSISLRGVLTAVRIDVVEENGIMGYWSANFKVIRND